MLQKLFQRRSRIAQGLNVPTAYASTFRSLRPCWKSFSSILWDDVKFFLFERRTCSTIDCLATVSGYVIN